MRVVKSEQKQRTINRSESFCDLSVMRNVTQRVILRDQTDRATHSFRVFFFLLFFFREIIACYRQTFLIQPHEYFPAYGCNRSARGNTMKLREQMTSMKWRNVRKYCCRAAIAIVARPWDKSGKKRFDRHACQVAPRTTVIPRVSGGDGRGRGEGEKPRNHVFSRVRRSAPPRISF